MGAGHRRRPPRQDGLDTRHPGRWAPAGVCSVCPGRGRRGARSIPVLECPRRRRSNLNHSAACPARCGPVRTARPRRPGRDRSEALPDPNSLQALTVFGQARSFSALHECRRGAVSVPPPASSRGRRCAALGDGVSGPFRAALKTYRKFEQLEAADIKRSEVYKCAYAWFVD